MKYDVGKETLFIPDTQAETDPIVSEFLSLLTPFIDYDFSKLMIRNVYELHIFMDSPEIYIQDRNICEKVKLFKILMESWEV